MGTSSARIAAPSRPGRRLLWLGVAVALLGVGLAQAQLALAWLTTPWYAPVTATLGAGLILLSLVRSRTAWRLTALVLFGLLAGGEWWFLLSYTRLPDYTGPVQADHPFPEFTAARADGTPFTRESLVGDKDTVLVFFRGWW
jgi:hypothetical protein